MLGGALLENNQGNMEAWIVDNQQLKPGNRMPEYDHFTGEQLRALAAYLESLE
jgi:cytochrome c oxidase subunit 2